MTGLVYAMECGDVGGAEIVKYNPSLDGLRAVAIHNNLAFDVGANTGQDTEALLARGFRVVAIEANPKLCADLRARFADEINDERLVIVDKAISGRKRVTFYVNSADSGWGTTLRATEGR